MAAAFRLTTGRWYNKLDEDGDYRKAPAYKEGFTYARFAYGSDTPGEFLPGDGTPVQQSLICAKQTQLLVADVDYPENLAASATGQILSWSDAMSVRGSHFHIGVDMRGVPEQDWPTQGRTAWGDIKCNGFVAAPGSVHYSGEPYAATSASPADKLVKATPELLAALAADRTAHALTRLNAGRAALGLAAGTRLDDGTYLYDSGFVRGTWAQLPDGHLKHDDELKDLLWDMHVIYGVEEEECRRQWFRLAGALGKPWTEKHFLRHWRHAPAKRAERESEENWLEETFGLVPLPPRMQAEQEFQQADWEIRAKQAKEEGRAEPTPIPADGPFENPYDDRSDLFDYYLGAQAEDVPGARRETFDAGRPNDSDNARAVLRRLHGNAVYLTDRAVWIKRANGRWNDSDLGANLRPVLAALEEVMPEGCGDPVKVMDKDPDTDGAEIAALKAQAKNLERFKSTSSRQSVATATADTAIRHAGRGLASRADLLDTEPEIMWAGGVPWDLRLSVNGPVRSSLRRDTPHLMSAAVVPDLSVATPLWDALCRALWPDPDGREWALQVLAITFTGYSDAVVPILMGDPGRGKTHLVKRLLDVLGGNRPWSYGGVMNADLLRSDAKLHGTFTLDLKGKRLAFVDEAPGHGMAAQRRLKSLTGGGDLQGNKMRENPVSFAPTHTLVMTANHEDPPPMDEPALQRRVRLIFFEGDLAEIDAASRDIDGGEPQRAAWRAEMPGVLAQMMVRAARWLADRAVADADRAPDRWRFKAADEVSTQDPVLSWLDSGEVAPDPAGTRAGLLRENFVAWCKRQGLSTYPSETKWGRRLNELGYPMSGRDAGGRYRPLRILPPGIADFMGGGSQPRSTTFSDPARSANPAQTQHPTNSQFRGGEVQGMYGLYSSNNTTYKEEKANPSTPPKYTPSHTTEWGKTLHPTQTPPHTPSDLGNDGSVHGLQTQHNPTFSGPTQHDLLPEPCGKDSCTSCPGDLGYAEGEARRAAAAAEPEATNTELPAENGEKAENGQNGNSPPKPKIPRVKMTPEERAARDLAKKEETARLRAEAKTAKVAELGGPLVQLPAVVLRDQRILPCTPQQAVEFLKPVLGEISVDVEHSGYPRTHKDYRLRLVQLGTEHFAVVLDPSDHEQANVIVWALQEAKVLHAHSALADLIPLEAAGFCDGSVWDKMRDTVIAAKLQDPALTESDEAALKPLARALLGEDYALSWRCEELKNAIFAAGGWLIECEVTTPVERSGWANIPVCEAFVRYAAADVMDCSAVWRVLLERGR